jgi:hypothetical protein
MITPNALTLAKRCISKQHLLSILTNSWELRAETITHYGVTNYVLHTHPTSYIKAAMKDGLITLDGIDYCVIYRSCSPSTLTKCAECRISYRAHPIGNFAIIQPLLYSTTERERYNDCN